MKNDPKDIAETLLARSPLPSLRPEGVWSPDFRTAIKAADTSDYIQATLHLLNDDLESAHLIAQKHEEPNGNLIHAIVHRREGDFGNSRYWLKRTGKHSIYTKIMDVYNDWTPEQFVHWCEEAPREKVKWLQEVQAYELRSLLTHFRLNI